MARPRGRASSRALLRLPIQRVHPVRCTAGVCCDDQGASGEVDEAGGKRGGGVWRTPAANTTTLPPRPLSSNSRTPTRGRQTVTGRCRRSQLVSPYFYFLSEAREGRVRGTARRGGKLAGPRKASPPGLSSHCWHRDFASAVPPWHHAAQSHHRLQPSEGIRALHGHGGRRTDIHIHPHPMS